MLNGRRSIFLMGLVLAALVTGVFLLPRDSVVEETDDPNQAPDFVLSTLDGGKIRLSEALETGPVLLDFWATWCAPCKKAMPLYAELVERYAEHGVQLLSINQDAERMQNKIAPYFEKQGFSFPALLDPKKEVASAYGVMVLPTSFLVAPDRTIAAKHVGFRLGDEKVLERELREVLGLGEGR
jgi:thiol-disulfide isomerase/thioredoxin